MKKRLCILSGVLATLAALYAWAYWPVSHQLILENYKIEVSLPRSYKPINTSNDLDRNHLKLIGNNATIELILQQRAEPGISPRSINKNVSEYNIHNRMFYLFPDEYAQRHGYGNTFTTLLENGNYFLNVIISPEGVDPVNILSNLQVLERLRVK